MSILDRLIPTPRLVEVDEVVLEPNLERTWELVRHGNLMRSRAIGALFALRALPARLFGGTREVEPPSQTLDGLASSADHPGFQILAEEPPFEVAVGAIGKVWHLDIPFVHVGTADAFAAFSESGYVKVAWSIRLRRQNEHHTRVIFEVRVDATDDESWKKFRAYFGVIGLPSRFIRRSFLAGLVREFGRPESTGDEVPLPGDELLVQPLGQLTHGITIHAKPEEIWPWLVQMGCHRGGFYSWDVLDNGGRRSAREVHPELQSIRVGDMIPATPDTTDAFEVLRVDPAHALVLGGLYDAERREQLPFASARPEKFWQVTWAFVLEPLDAERTRLRVRARACSPTRERVHLTWIRFLHHFMETAQLRHLAARVEGRLPKSDWRDVLEGVAGVAIMASAFFTPFLRERRSHWGMSGAEATRLFPGDEFVPRPLWSFTHAIEIDRPAEHVWPWVSQVGSDKAGFYSYQSLENLAGCGIRNAETVHPQWEVREGDKLTLHPSLPSPKVASVVRGSHFVAVAPPDERARAEGRPWVAMSWLFLVQPLGATRCRVVSRYRADCSPDVVTHLSFGPTLLEPIGFAMDRRMLFGIKERAETPRALEAANL